MFACREGIGIITQGITLVIVADSVAEIDGIGGIGLQRVYQINHYLLALRLDFRHLQLRGRHNDILACISQLDKFVEIDGYLLARHIRGLVFRRTT